MIGRSWLEVIYLDDGMNGGHYYLATIDQDMVVLHPQSTHSTAVLLRASITIHTHNHTYMTLLASGSVDRSGGGHEEFSRAGQHLAVE